MSATYYILNAQGETIPVEVKHATNTKKRTGLDSPVETATRIVEDDDNREHSPDDAAISAGGDNSSDKEGVMDNEDTKT